MSFSESHVELVEGVNDLKAEFSGTEVLSHCNFSTMFMKFLCFRAKTVTRMLFSGEYPLDRDIMKNIVFA